MSFCNWLYRLAAGGILAAQLAGEGNAQSSSYPVAPNTENQPAAVADAYNEPSCKPPKSSEEAGFCIQRRSTEAAEQQAMWAREQAFWNQAQFWLGFIGLIAVVVTIRYTKRAAEEAGNAAVAAVKTFELTRRDFHFLHRPKLRVRKVVIPTPHDGKRLNVTIEIVNVGNGTAVVDLVQADLDVRDSVSGQHRHKGTGATQLSNAPLLPGSGTEVTFPLDLTWDYTSFLGIVMGIKGSVVYRDIVIGQEPGAVFASTRRKTGFGRACVELLEDESFRFAPLNPDPEYEYED